VPHPKDSLPRAPLSDVKPPTLSERQGSPAALCLVDSPSLEGKEGRTGREGSWGREEWEQGAVHRSQAHLPTCAGARACSAGPSGDSRGSTGQRSFHDRQQGPGAWESGGLVPGPALPIQPEDALLGEDGEGQKRVQERSPSHWCCWGAVLYIHLRTASLMKTDRARRMKDANRFRVVCKPSDLCVRTPRPKRDFLRKGPTSHMPQGCLTEG
ncbi:unnamed protein product, partial [Gulo gulo]